MRYSVALLAFTLIVIVVSYPLAQIESSNASGSVESKVNGTNDSDSAQSEVGSLKTSDNKNSNSTSGSGSGSSILKSQSYSSLQISDGKAGNAAQEAISKFQGIDKANLASVSDQDLKLVQGIHDVAEKAEVNAFNPAIASATGDEAKALKNGKIKNKVLKTSAAVLALEIEKAKGKTINEKKLAKQKAKKAKNISLDASAKDQPSKGVAFSGSSGD